MERNQNQNQQENQNQNNNCFPITLTNPMELAQNPISYLNNFNSDLLVNEQTKNNNIFIQKRNRTDYSNEEIFGKLKVNEEQENKNGEMNDVSSDINMKSPHQKNNKLYQVNQINNHEQFISKKMSIDLNDDDTNQNLVNKKCVGCNCKNS